MTEIGEHDRKIDNDKLMFVIVDFNIVVVAYLFNSINAISYYLN